MKERLKASKAVQIILSHLSIAKDRKSVTMALVKEFESIGCLFYQEC